MQDARPSEGRVRIICLVQSNACFAAVGGRMTAPSSIRTCRSAIFVRGISCPSGIRSASELSLLARAETEDATVPSRLSKATGGCADNVTDASRLRCTVVYLFLDKSWVSLNRDYRCSSRCDGGGGSG